jgi:PAS domain S-box-containing protein
MVAWQDRLLVEAFGPHAQGDDGVQRWVASIGIAVAVGVAFFLAAQLGLALLTTEERVAVFWPASGIAAGSLIALGSRARVPVATGVIAASLAANVLGDRSFLSALVFGLCNAAEALLVMWLIERWFGPAFNLDSLRRVVGFFTAAALATATAAAGASVAMKLFGPSTAALLDVWKVWFPSGVLGIVTVAPLLIGVAAVVRDAPSRRELLEGILAVVVLTAVIGLLLAVLSGPWSLIGPSALYFPLLLWLVSRCHPVFAAAAVFTIAGAIVWTTTHDIGRYGDPTQPIAIRVLAAQVVMLGTTLTALALAALFAERRKYEATIAERNAQLALAGKTALVGTYVFDLNSGKVQVSAGYVAIYGLPAGTEEYRRDEWEARVHPDDLVRLDALRSEAFAERRSEHRSEYRIVRPGGEVRWIESRAFVSYDDDGRAQRMVGVNIDVTERKRLEEHQKRLVAELDHRVKNMLATVAAVAKHTSEHSASLIDFDRRIQSMADAHALLSGSQSQSASLADLVRHELAPYDSGENTSAVGPYVGLTPTATQTMAMVLHELATNAKYGALSTPLGWVSVRWDLQSNGSGPAQLRLQWHENGGPLVTTPGRPGYGTSVIRELVPYELGGTVEIEYKEKGVSCTIEFAIQSDGDRAAPLRSEDHAKND